MTPPPAHDAAAIAEIANPPAFPMGNPEQGGYDGMTLRDWFAGQALPAAYTYASARIREGMDMNYLPEEWTARIAYGVADAMLLARASLAQSKGEE